jgi:hypothetical protein
MRVGGRPDISYGDRFSVRSVRGSEYRLTLLAFGSQQSGLYVRLDDGRIARLDPERLRWDSYEALPPGGPPLRAGDEVLVECASGSLRGKLLEPVAREVALRLAIGSDVRLPREEVDELYLLFLASDLQPGDQVIMNSKSGNEYRGTIKALTSDNRLFVDLRNGGEANLRLSKLDLGSVNVQVPLPIGLIGG